MNRRDLPVWRRSRVRGAGRNRPRSGAWAAASRRRAETFEVTKTEAEWRAHPQRAAVRGAAPGGHRASRHQPAAAREAQGHLPLRRLRPAALFVGDQVRIRHRLAEFLGIAAQRRRHQGGQFAVHDAHRSAIAAAAAAISATSSTTARRRPASATASTAWR